MNSFIKENASLVIALALPVLFAMFFYLSKGVSHKHVEPPKYDFVIVNGNSRNTFDFAVIDEKLNVTFTHQTIRGNGQPFNVQRPELYYVDADTLIAEPINIEIPAEANNPPEELQGTRITMDVEKFNGKKFNAAAISPDGFELTYHNKYRDGNIMTEIFSGHRSHENGLVLAKDGAKFDIRGINRHYGFNVVGWVTEEE